MADISLEGMSPEAINGLAQLAKGLSDNATTRREFLALVKKADPTQNIPEIDIPEQFTTMISAEREARVKLENEIRDREVRAEIERKRMEIQGMGIAADKVAEVEKLMTERSIGDHKTAAEFYISQQRMAEPTPPQTPFVSMELPKFDLTKGNVRTQGKQVAAELLHGFRTGKVAVP